MIFGSFSYLPGLFLSLSREVFFNHLLENNHNYVLTLRIKKQLSLVVAEEAPKSVLLEFWEEILHFEIVVDDYFDNDFDDFQNHFHVWIFAVPQIHFQKLIVRLELFCNTKLV